MLSPSVDACMSFLKAEVLKKGHFIFKFSSLLFYLSFKMRRRLNFFFRNSGYVVPYCWTSYGNSKSTFA